MEDAVRSAFAASSSGDGPSVRTSEQKLRRASTTASTTSRCSCASFADRTRAAVSTAVPARGRDVTAVPTLRRSNSGLAPRKPRSAYTMHPGCERRRCASTAATSNGWLASMRTARASTTFSSAPRPMSSSARRTIVRHWSRVIAATTPNSDGGESGSADNSGRGTSTSSMTVRHVRPSSSRPTIIAGTTR